MNNTPPKNNSVLKKMWTWVKDNWLISVIAIISCLFVLYSVNSLDSLLLRWKGIPPGEPAGQFGDQYGALNTLFTGLAFIGLIITIFLQNRDLNLQRKEMRNAIAEQQEQTRQFREQTEQQKKQIEQQRTQYENQLLENQKSARSDEFFRRLTLLKQMESDIHIISGNGSSGYIEKKSHSAISDIYNEVINIIKQTSIDENISEYAITFTKNYNDSLFAWMRTFFTLFADINENKSINETEKSSFLRILINTLTKREKTLIYLYYDFLESPSVKKQMEKSIMGNYMLESEIPELFIVPENKQKLHDLLRE